MEKQIEEMAKVIKMSLDDLGSGHHHFTGNEISTMFAKCLYNAGYRKESDVAREIFEEIKKIVENNRYKSYLPNSCLWSYSYRIGEIIKDIAELKNKYIGEDINVTTNTEDLK